MRTIESLLHQDDLSQENFLHYQKSDLKPLVDARIDLMDYRSKNIDLESLEISMLKKLLIQQPLPAYDEMPWVTALIGNDPVIKKERIKLSSMLVNDLYEKWIDAGCRIEYS